MKRIGLVVVLSILLLAPAAAVAAAGTMQTTHTRHYTIHSDLSADAVDALGSQMDALYEEYDRRLTGFRREEPVPRLRVYLFRTRADYQRLVGPMAANSAGVFVPGDNYLAAVHEGVRREDLRTTLQHEAWHQFAHNRIGPHMPIWLNEGLAQVFEDGYWFGREFRLGAVPPGRHGQLVSMMQARRLVPVRAMMSMTLEQWNQRIATDPPAAQAQYAQAWAMAHMLVFATEGGSRPHYRPHLIDMLRRLSRGVDGDRAFREAFSDNIDGFEQRFTAYLHALRPDEQAEYRARQRLLAELVSTTRGIGYRFSTIDDLRGLLRKRMDLLPLDQRRRLERQVEYCFSYANGERMPASALHLARNPAGHIPDLICRPSAAYQIRTRFYPTATEEPDFEQFVEPVR